MRQFKRILAPSRIGFQPRRVFSEVTEVFDRQLHRRHRLRSMQPIPGVEADYYDYLRNEGAERLVDRLDDIQRSFSKALELGSYKSKVYSLLCDREHHSGKGGIGGVETLFECDIAKTSTQSLVQESDLIKRIPMAVDEEFLPFKDGSFDLVLSSMEMHWINDLPGALADIRRVLRPDGVFVGCMLGGGTLQELKYCLYVAQQDRTGGLSPHMSPLAEPSEIAALMQANFALPTVDCDKVTIGYPDAFSLMEHLGLMGEGNCNLTRSLHIGKDTLLAAAAMYQEMFALEDGTISATYEFIYMTGWAHDASQAKPLRRGSAQRSFKELNTLKTNP